MLGINFFRGWTWGAYGKHPAVGDFFRLGSENRSTSLFAEWMNRGYSVQCGGRDVNSLRIWRFWAKGEKRDDLICGLLRDSHDTLGRPYPLLVIGSGRIDAWEDHWDILPVVCENTWSQIEYSVTRNINDLKQLETEICNTPPPQPDWADAREPAAGHALLGPDYAGSPSHISNAVTTLCRAADFELFQFNREIVGNCRDNVVSVHRELKERVPRVPNVVFIGGSYDTTYLACYKRPLQLADFTALWAPSIGKTE